MMSFIGVGIADILIGPVPGRDRADAADAVDDFDKLMPAIPARRSTPASSSHSSCRGRALPADQDRVRAAAAHSRSQPSSRQARRRQRPSPGHHELPDQRRPHRCCRRRLGAQPAAGTCGRTRSELGDLIIPFVFLARLNALAWFPSSPSTRCSSRRHVSHDLSEPAHRLPARAGGPHPAVHDGDRVPRPQAGTRRELRHPRPQALLQIADRPQEVSMTVLIASEICHTAVLDQRRRGRPARRAPLMFTAWERRSRSGQACSTSGWKA